MLKIEETERFKSARSGLDKSYLVRLGKLVAKIIERPEIGKPMKFDRKNTREVYLTPFRISYLYDNSENLLVFLDVYHKKKQ